jgi:hypothetical protein
MAAGAALALLVPGGIIFKALTAAVTAATVAYIKFTQMTLEMVDKLHKGYQGLSKSGAAAADGMSGLYRDSKKLGLSMGELDSFVQLVAENSKDFALFAGSVSEGRKRLADMGEAAAGNRVELMNLGMTTQDINAGMAGYIKLQTRLGQAQSMTTQQLAAGAVAYLKEQDALTKLTGQSRQEMEQQRERALQKEQFAAKIQQLRNDGQDVAAEKLLKLNSIYEAAGPQMASAFQASVTGNLSNADAQKANLASNGEMIRTTQLVISGQMDYVQAAQTTGMAIKQTANTIGTTLGQFNAYSGTFGELHEQLKLGQMATGDLVKNYDKILADQKNQMAGTDAMTKAQSELVNRQIAYNRQMEDLMMANVPAAQKSVDALAQSSMKAAEALAGMAGPKGLIQRTIDMITAKDSKELAQVGGNETFGELAGGAGGGIAAGAIAGGLVGSIVPVVGTAIGAAVGGVLGAMGGSALGGMIGKYVDETTNAEADKSSKNKPIEKRAAGGPVNKSTPYLVGEEGPEIFVPKGAGDIVPNDRLGAGASIGGDFSTAIDQMFESVKTQEKILDVDTVRMKKFSDLQKNYFDTYGGFMLDMSEQATANDPKDVSSRVGRMFSNIFGGDSELQIPKASNLTGMSDNFYKAVEETLKDVKTQEKILDVDTVRMKKFSDLQKNYFDTYGGFMRDVIEQVENNDPKDTTSGVGSMFSGILGMFGSSGSSGGLQMPKATNIMGMGGGQGLQATSQSDLTKLGLNVKSGDVQAAGAGISPKLIEMSKAIQGGVPGFGYFSAFNDKFHQENASSSKHTQGLAADFTTAQAPSPQDGKQITSWLKSMGASLAIDEYNNPSSKSTAGHFHVEIPAFEDGGNVPAGQLGIAGENGKPELITGPASVTPNNDIMGAFGHMTGLMQQQVTMLDELIRAQKDNNDISNKMLRMQT